MSILKTALIGFGFSSRTFHLPHLKEHPQFEITTIIIQKRTYNKKTANRQFDFGSFIFSMRIT